MKHVGKFLYLSDVCPAHGAHKREPAVLPRPDSDHIAIAHQSMVKLSEMSAANFDL